MVVGFGVMALCIALFFTHLSDTAHLWATIFESIGVGVGGVGFGMFFFSRNHRNQGK